MLCFIAFHGDPNQHNRTKVGVGSYPVHGVWPDGIAEGDYLLLYCFENYKEYANSAPAVGVVRRADKSTALIRYATHWLKPAVSRAELEQTMSDFGDVQVRSKLLMPRSGTRWVYEIDRRAFERLTTDRWNEA